jgi:hypothetical protein
MGDDMTDSLLSRLRSLTAPSREIDAEIALANGWQATFAHTVWMSPDKQLDHEPPRYTESLDAALTLKPADCRWKVGDWYNAYADITLANGVKLRADASNPAIALLIAIMKAKAEKQESPRPAIGGQVMPYPIIMNGDHAESEREHADTPPQERPDWPLPSFDVVDWAKAFLKAYENGPEDFLDEGTMIAWFANALMRGYDEHDARTRGPYEALMAAINEVLSASDEFRAGMGPEWEGDPLTDACDQLRAALRAAGLHEGKGK